MTEEALEVLDCLRKVTDVDLSITQEDIERLKDYYRPPERAAERAR